MRAWLKSKVKRSPKTRFRTDDSLTPGSGVGGFYSEQPPLDEPHRKPGSGEEANTGEKPAAAGEVAIEQQSDAPERALASNTPDQPNTSPAVEAQTPRFLLRAPTGALENSQPETRSIHIDLESESATSGPRLVNGPHSVSGLRSVADSASIRSELSSAKPIHTSVRHRSSQSNVSSVDDSQWKSDSIFPFSIETLIHLTLDDKNLPDVEYGKIEWYKGKESVYSPLWDAAQSRINKEMEILGIQGAVDLRNGSFRLVSERTPKNATSPRKLDDEDQMIENLVKEACGFIHRCAYEKFKLEINWNFSSFCIDPVEGIEYKKTIIDAIHKKCQTNFRGEIYFPRSDLNSILSPSNTKNIMKRIIDEDASLPTEEEKEALLEKISSFKAPKLLALCVYARLDMKFLDRLLKPNSNISDANPPTKGDCPGEDLKAEFDHFMEKLPAFYTYQFGLKENEDEIKIPDNKIIPIQRIMHLGTGAYSDVYQIRIHPSHHVFSQDKSQHFALKVFKEARPDKNALQLKQNLKYEQEYGVLKNLKKFKASTHDHILESFAAWSYRDSFNILFALADCNLRTFMKNYGASDARPIPCHPSTHLPLLDKTFVKWFLYQIYGLCDGIKHLHRLEPSTPSPRLEVSPHGKSAAFHHDIKPENILVALDPHSGYGTLKFGDFGSANVQTLRDSAIYKLTTVGEKKQTGTITYEAPDLYITGSATRKADIWSLGCVFLEIMVWCFVPNGLKTFSQERLEVHPDEPNVSTDRFWKSIPGNLKDAALRPAVTEKLDDLEKTYCRKMRAFERVLFYIRQMLIVNVDKKSDKPLRIAAPELENDMKVILDQAEIDLKKQPNFYVRPSSAELSEEVLKPALPTPSSLGAQSRNLAEFDENAPLPQPARGDEPQPLGSLKSGHLSDQTSFAAVGGMFTDTHISGSAATDIARFGRELQRNSSSPLP